MDTVRIANCSGFWGDRFTAAEEMVEGGTIDVLTGDYLAELTMALLHRARMKDSKAGFVPTFVAQLERVLPRCIERGIKVVANAGGLAPASLAAQVGQLGAKLGVPVRVACVDGDDLLPRLDELAALGEPLAHLDHGTPLAECGGIPVTANAYLGGWGIREALAKGADVVVTGRVADASLVIGPAAWKLGLARDDWDRLAAAAVAGHLLECGCQVTGGNYPFFEEVTLRRVGFPLAEIAADGSFEITKHPGTGGAVTVGTVTAQLLYEVAGPRYLGPDVTARFDTVELAEVGPDRVRCTGVRGEPPPVTAKVAANVVRGWRAGVTLLVAAPRVDRKVAILR